ncbi:glycogen debranching N-terminal domain-containing protein [Microbacterium sp. ASV49]|uniref:Glycogen debranching N-terminal domain-containing protein n=1 Tax=Microbacterium candidum TaxID=3041922 RepID=A0ABT7N1Q0_9MICO|nr:glycogen debranching N-terminal domain-containing protein [Microbacterium sp. ASV49]MDL9980596.1 glycogen debranching N-terminal domain-containing protein [Microbacterium sp. ASV49]
MTPGRQPYLYDAVIALAAPTQVWSRECGDMTAPIDGVYHGDRRFIGALALRCAGVAPEPIGSASRSVSEVVFDATVREIDDPSPDPHVRLTRSREVEPGEIRETITLRSVAPRTIDADVTVRLQPDFRPLQEVKAGIGGPRASEELIVGEFVTVTADTAHLHLTAEGGRWRRDGDTLEVSWRMHVEPGDAASVVLAARLEDASLVVQAAPAVTWPVPDAADPRLAAWLRTALGDLAALRLALPDHPADAFLAAGAPWFLTLFGRDSLWAARLLLPVDAGLAASTLRVLARLQGTRDDRETEEEPGKIAHELRSVALVMPGEGIVLPPLYYGTVDATALWVSLLVEAAAAGMPESEVRELLPNLRAALDWIVRSTGDGFLSYVDRTGRGLANQGWKDSGDSIQWRDGTLAAGPIALCEVQGYAYEAAVGAAALLDALGEPGGPDLRAWAASLRTRFAEAFWVETPEGRYPAIALDRDGRAVDTLTSNIGHLLGTGILSPAEEKAVAALLVGASMSSGFGIRTLSTDAAGYWPLGYHRGSVWAHDTAIVARGMLRAGLLAEARETAEGMLRAAEAFGYRMPELHSGDSAAQRAVPAPYPAACRPQAWSAAAAITCLDVLAG